LNPEQLAAFERDGFLIVRHVFSSNEAARHARAIEALADLPPAVGRQMVYFEDSLIEKGARVLLRIEKFVEYDEVLGGRVVVRRMVEPAGALLGDRAVLFKEKINFKLPGGGGFTPHQDIQPGWDTYAPYFLSVLVAIDPNTIENGCL